MNLYTYLTTNNFHTFTEHLSLGNQYVDVVLVVASVVSAVAPEPRVRSVYCCV